GLGAPGEPGAVEPVELAGEREGGLRRRLAFDAQGEAAVGEEEAAGDRRIDGGQVVDDDTEAARAGQLGEAAGERRGLGGGGARGAGARRRPDASPRAGVPATERPWGAGAAASSPALLLGVEPTEPRLPQAEKTSATSAAAERRRAIIV